MPATREIPENNRDHPRSSSAPPRLRGEIPRLIRFRFPAFLLSAFVLLAATSIAAANNPYTGIVDRNVFNLRPPVKLDDTPKPPPTPPIKLTLTGITTILGNKRALLKGQMPPRPPEPAKDESYMLSEGQRQDGIEVVSIDEQGGKVVVSNNGITETLDFLNNGAKLVASAAAPMTPGVVPPPPSASGIPQPGVPGATGRGIPVRPSGQSTPSANPDAGMMGGASSHTSMAQSDQPFISPEEQTVMIEAQRMQLQEAGKHEEASIFPITEMTPTWEGQVHPQ